MISTAHSLNETRRPLNLYAAKDGKQHEQPRTKHGFGRMMNAQCIIMNEQPLKMNLWDGRIIKMFNAIGMMEWSQILSIAFFRRKNATSQTTCRFSQTHNQTAMPFSAQGINCLNQILEEMND